MGAPFDSKAGGREGLTLLLVHGYLWGAHGKATAQYKGLHDPGDVNSFSSPFLD